MRTSGIEKGDRSATPVPSRPTTYVRFAMTQIRRTTRRTAQPNMQEKDSKQEGKSQEGEAKELTPEDLGLHPALVCDIAPDVRPFEWPKRKKGKPEVVLEVGLWDFGTQKFFRDLDEVEVEGDGEN